jgi:hypothetical protein
MKKIHLFLLLFLTINFSLSAQNDFSYASISPELKENSNSVARLRQRDIVISSKKVMTIVTKDVVTVLNEKGLSHVGASEYFDKSTKIKSIEALILDASGKEIKKIKRKDFLENSVSQGSIITDNKMLYMDYTPTSYPFTVVFQSEVESSNTAFIPAWYPIQRSYEGIEKSSLTITASADLGFKYKEFNMQGNQNIVNEAIPNGASFTASNLMALKDEEYSPSYRNFIPHVLFGLETFNLEGVEGTASNWKDFGAWVYTNLLIGTDEIPLETQVKMKALVGNEKDPIKIAKIVYQYVQNKTRYISIQLGIGGWKPMLAKDVDRLGYGDCKALTNYTRALLNVVGVPSYYTIIYGDSQKRDLHQDFVSMQGNHVILALPVNEKIYWLECTSQTNPFGFQGDFTDNRLALLVKPEGGEIIRTHEYVVKENTQLTNGNFIIDENGSFLGTVLIKSKGTQYDNKSVNENRSVEDLNKFYKSYFGHINNLKLKKINVGNNKEDVEFSEEVFLEASEYAQKGGDRLIFALNAYNPVRGIPQRYRTRTTPFEIARGFYDYDEITISLPKGFSIEAKPDNFELKDKFGDYKTEYIVLNENQLLYKRTFQTNSGYYDKSDYENFRKFREQVAKSDNAKIVLVKN